MRLSKSALFILTAIGLALIFIIAAASCSGSGAKKSPAPARSADLSQIAAELQALEVPEGVDEALFAKLTNELFEQIKIRVEKSGAERFSSAAPAGDFGKVIDLELDPETSMLKWSYVNLGDYDFSGETGVPDITPIALHYGAIVGDEIGNDILEAWIDGDNNGEVGIPDITPIALNYLGEVFEYALLEADEPDGEFTEVLRIPYSLASEDLPKSFETALSSGGKRYVAVQPLDRQGNPGELSNIVDTVDILQKDLEIVQSSITVTVLIGNSGQRTINIRNNTEAAIDWTLSVNQPWMELDTDFGTTAAGEVTDVVVSFSSEGMGISTSTGRITLEWEGGTDTCGVVFRIISEGALPIIEEESLSFAADLGETLVKPIKIRNDGNVSMNWQLTSSQPWLSFSQASGTLNPTSDMTIQVTATTGSMTPGSYNATITLQDTADTENKDTCPVGLVITDIGDSLSHVTADGSLSGNGTSLDPWIFPSNTTSVQFHAFGFSGKEITANFLTSFGIGGAVGVSPGTAFSSTVKGRLIWGAFDTNVQITVQFRDLPVPPRTYWIYKSPVED